MNIKKFLETLFKKNQIDKEVLLNTEYRFWEALEELTNGYNKDPKNCIKVFPCKKEEKMEIKVVTPYFSLCEHHILPFYGNVSLTYFPDKWVIGLSKIPRIVKIFSRRLQLQERLTTDVIDTFFSVVNPKWVEVKITGIHLCCQARGANVPATMETFCRREKNGIKSK